jgi:hypothetical protein
MNKKEQKGNKRSERNSGWMKRNKKNNGRTKRNEETIEDQRK